MNIFTFLMSAIGNSMKKGGSSDDTSTGIPSWMKLLLIAVIATVVLPSELFYWVMTPIFLYAAFNKRIARWRLKRSESREMDTDAEYSQKSYLESRFALLCQTHKTYNAADPSDYRRQLFVTPVGDAASGEAYSFVFRSEELVDVVDSRNQLAVLEKNYIFVLDYAKVQRVISRAKTTSAKKKFVWDRGITAEYSASEISNELNEIERALTDWQRIDPS